MIFSHFDDEQFFNDTVLPLTSTIPPFGRESSLPIDHGLIPVLSFDNRERFTYAACRVGYFPVNHSVEVGIITINQEDDLPVCLAVYDFSLPDHRPFDGIVVARSRTHMVAGLREAETQQWQKTRSFRDINRFVIDAVRVKSRNHKISPVTTEPTND